MGCATIITNRGGLIETTSNPIILKKLNSNELFKLIENLINNRKKEFIFKSRIIAISIYHTLMYHL